MNNCNINLRYKNREIKSLFDIPEILLGKIDVAEYADTLNYEYLSEIAFEQRILAPFYKIYKKYISEECLQKIEENLNIRRKKKDYQLQYLKIIKEEFQNNNIDFIIIKGFAISALVYEDMYQRDFSDCDLIVDIKDFKRVNEIMISLGYYSNLGNGDIPDLLPLECYELEYFKEFAPGMEMCVEIKLGTSSIKSIEIIRKFLKNKVQLNIDGEEYYSFSLNDTFILLCTNTYCNFELEFAVARIRDLIDVKLFYEKYRDVLDLDYIVEFVEKNKQKHQIYAVLRLLNYFYSNTFSNEFINRFSIDSITYDKNVFQNYLHGWMRDWIVEPVDLMLNRKWHFQEICFQQSCKAYSSRNKNYYNKVLIPKSEQMLDNGIVLQGLKSKENRINHLYQFSHIDDKIYFKLILDEYFDEFEIKTTLIIFDIDRQEPRKMIEFRKEKGVWNSKALTSGLIYKEVSRNEREIVIEINKENFRILDKQGKNLCLYMYSIRNFYNAVDFALKDDNQIMDYENPIMIYLCD